MAAKEITILGEWLYDAAANGPLAANTEWRPSASQGKAELDTKEVAEIAYIEIRSPITDTGVAEALDHVYVYLDETSVRQYVNLCGRHTANMGPPRPFIEGLVWVPFGKSIVDAVKDPIPALATTTLKYRQSARIVAVAGSTAITQNFLIRLWGYRYTEDELRRTLVDNYGNPVTSINPSVSITDRTTGKTLYVSKPSIPISWDSWNILPGAPKQEKPIIMPYFRWAINKNATTPNTEYQYRFETGQVAQEEMNMYFPFDVNANALFVKGFGVRKADNLKYAWIALTSDTLHKEHPKGKFHDFDELHFGASQPLRPDGYPTYFAIPRFADDSLLIYNDLAYVAIQDNQNPVAANSVYVALNGVYFELRK